ncbi:hypothetical protein NW754_014656 [Fusarium falciforme]|nr:hypothetical protein NW754_014656 [Fusarium falciforme]
MDDLLYTSSKRVVVGNAAESTEVVQTGGNEDTAQTQLSFVGKKATGEAEILDGTIWQ